MSDRNRAGGFITNRNNDDSKASSLLPRPANVNPMPALTPSENGDSTEENITKNKPITSSPSSPLVLDPLGLERKGRYAPSSTAVIKPPNYQTKTSNEFLTWNAEKVADYFSQNGLEDYHETILHHKITGKVACKLNDMDLTDMGIILIGDRCRFRYIIQNLMRQERAEQRLKVMWEGEEKIFFGCLDEAFGSCCGCCPEDPSTYKLTQSYMKVKKVNPIRVGFITCPCHSSYTINNIDLTYVNDVDVLGVPPPLCQKILCCAQGKDIVDISTTTDDGKVLLFLHQDLGEPVANLILSQVEDAQVMERD